MIGFFWFIIVMITLWSHKVWSNYEEDMEEFHEGETLEMNKIGSAVTDAPGLRDSGSAVAERI